jgi:hypothetical protein
MKLVLIVIDGKIGVRLLLVLTVDIYEWVRSPVMPSELGKLYWNRSIVFMQYGINYSPSGTVRNITNPAWTQTIEFDSAGNSSTWYYFWVKNAITLPMPNNRTLTTLQISNTITNPGAYGVSWYAAIDT